MPTDLAGEADLRRLVDAAVDRFGGVDVLINNAAATAGEYWSKRFLDLTREEWLYQFDVNLDAPFTLSQLVTPIVASRGGGRILNLSTGSGEVFRLPEEPPKLASWGEFSLAVPGYYASKRALDRLGNVLAPELAQQNIAVIGLHPGFVASEIVAARIEGSGLDDSQTVPMAVPARMLVYFASCADPMEYTGRLFWAERELAELGLELDEQTAIATRSRVGCGGSWPRTPTPGHHAQPVALPARRRLAQLRPLHRPSTGPGHTCGRRRWRRRCCSRPHHSAAESTSPHDTNACHRAVEHGDAGVGRHRVRRLGGRAPFVERS